MPTPIRNHYVAPVSSGFRVVVGLGALVAGLVTGLIAGLVAWDLWTGGLGGEGKAAPLLAMGATFSGLSLLMFVWAFRLILGKPRTADQGLLSPVALRVAAAFFLSLPVLLLVFGGRIGFGFLTLLGISVACWTLASIRVRARATMVGSTRMRWVIKEIAATDGRRKVQIFRRKDGSFGFESLRLSDDPLERSWIPEKRYSECFIADEASAEYQARNRIAWLRDGGEDTSAHSS